MRVLVTGAGGQLGTELLATAPAGAEVHALDRSALDITDENAVREVMARVGPMVVLNAAAYTSVDRAEEERDSAWKVNCGGVAILARLSEQAGARLVHFSTDFVFDGAASTAYSPDATPHPVSVYGESKLAGEIEVLGAPGGTVLRTSRVYSSDGRNFVTSMLRAFREQRDLRIVDDQVGSPTWVHGLAEVAWVLAGRDELDGIWHWSDGGSCSWYEWARTILRYAEDRHLIDAPVSISPVPTGGYPAAATRPPYSVLDSAATVEALGIAQASWEESLGTMFDEMVHLRSQ